MDEWKVRQLLYKSFAVKHDLIEYPTIKAEYSINDLIVGITSQFNDSSQTTHPYKSYCVALVYAYNLAKKYGNSQLYYLNDPGLLPEDPCFVTYESAKLVYNHFVGETWWHKSDMGLLIKQYWYDEYCSEIDYAS